VTSGGLHGVVVGTSDDVLTVDLGVHDEGAHQARPARVERRVEKASDEETA
jgi:preprotein translocase subunit YajC